MRDIASFRRSRRIGSVVLVVVLSLATAGIAVAAGISALTTYTPQSANQITNLDVLRQQIKNYYGTPTAAAGSSCDQNLAPNPNGNYAKEAESVAANGASWLAARARAHAPSGIKAIVLDVDDTTLATWNYELCSNWDYNPVTNANFVNGELFPAVPGMVGMVSAAAQEGYAIIWITGRPTTQEAATLGNLTKAGVGYPAPTTLNDGEDGLFTKPANPADYPAYLTAACASDPGGKCTTIHYKSATRAHIESLGYEIVGNFGDQFSDLIGGFADKTFKLPNPNYYLP